MLNIASAERGIGNGVIRNRRDNDNVAVVESMGNGCGGAVMEVMGRCGGSTQP